MSIRNVNFKEDYGFWPTVCVLVVMHYCLGGIQHLPTATIAISYAIMLLCQLRGGFKFNTLWLLLALYLPVELLIAQPDSVFRPWARLGLFLMLYLAASSTIESNKAIKFRQQCMNVLSAFCVTLSVASFFAYFLGINFFEDRYAGGYIDDYVGSAGHFSGFASHSQTLAPIAGFACLVMYHKALLSKKIFHWALAICCAGTMLFTASRSALIAAVAGFIALTYYYSSKKSTFLKYILIVSVVAAVSFPLWQSAADGLLNKQSARTEEGGIFDSRTTKGLARLEEFTSSPFFGVGFASIDPNGIDGFNDKTGTIEPGISWFAILSMTGIIGFAVVLVLFIRSFNRCRLNHENCLLVGLLVMFTMHMFGEGYVFAAGNPLTFSLWLVLGSSYDCHVNNNKDENFILSKNE